MHTVSQAFDSRAMPFAEPSTAPSALSFWLWRWLGDRADAKGSHDEDELRGDAQGTRAADPRLASEQRAAADLLELRHGR
ncbi:MAG TPA: hypothetical protein VLE45_09040 [Burkholderiaceae bacterium]|nr:hypothetical protein [Burkholderiaceae bacterium]